MTGAAAAVCSRQGGRKKEPAIADFIWQLGRKWERLTIHKLLNATHKLQFMKRSGIYTAALRGSTSLSIKRPLQTPCTSRRYCTEGLNEGSLHVVRILPGEPSPSRLVNEEVFQAAMRPINCCRRPEDTPLMCNAGNTGKKIPLTSLDIMNPLNISITNTVSWCSRGFREGSN